MGAFLLFSTSSNSSLQGGSLVRGRLANSTTVQFVRSTPESTPAPITIRWSVVEYARGVRVQRGEVLKNGATVNASVIPVASTEQAFLTWSKTASTMETIWRADTLTLGELAGEDRIRFRSNTAPAGSDVIWWQVVEFTNPADLLVQRGTTTLSGAALSINRPLSNSVDRSRAFLTTEMMSRGGGSVLSAPMARGQITDPSTIQFDRQSSAGNPIVTISWQVVELREGSRIQFGSAAFAVDQSQATASITPVDTTRTTGIASTNAGAGMSAGRTSQSTGSTLGVAEARIEFPAGNLVRLTRAETTAATNISWFVIVWGATS